MIVPPRSRDFQMGMKMDNSGKTNTCPQILWKRTPVFFDSTANKALYRNLLSFLMSFQRFCFSFLRKKDA